MLEFFVGAGLGVLYVEILYRLLKKGTALALFTYPVRIFIFAIIMGMFVLGGGLIKVFPLIVGFLFGFFAEYLSEGVWEAWSF